MAESRTLRCLCSGGVLTPLQGVTERELNKLATVVQQGYEFDTLVPFHLYGAVHPFFRFLQRARDSSPPPPAFPLPACHGLGGWKSPRKVTARPSALLRVGRTHGEVCSPCAGAALKRASGPKPRCPGLKPNNERKPFEEVGRGKDLPRLRMLVSWAGAERPCRWRRPRKPKQEGGKLYTHTHTRNSQDS